MTPQRQEPVDGERASLDDVLTRLYEVISFNEGGEPDWDGMRDVFSRHARITRVTPEGTDHLDLPTFCAMCGPKFCSMHHTRSIDEQIEALAQEQGLVPSARAPRETAYARELAGAGD
jgi:hypothetical protein